VKTISEKAFSLYIELFEESNIWSPDTIYRDSDPSIEWRQFETDWYTNLHNWEVLR